MTSAAASAGRPAIVLLSGGLDSTTTLAMATAQGFAVHALAFRYGQRHAVELQSAARVAAQFGVRSFRIVDVDLRAFGGSALTSDLAVPKARTAAEMGHDIPITYVPARNTLFLAFAVGAAEVVGARDVFIGANALDYSGYPDCRPEFLRAFEVAANLGTKMGVEARDESERLHIQAPLLALTKAQIIVEGIRLGVDYAQTWSCYDPVNLGGGGTAERWLVAPVTAACCAKRASPRRASPIPHATAEPAGVAPRRSTDISTQHHTHLQRGARG